MKTKRQTEFGDFQTPPALATEVCTLLKKLGISPDAIIEPTCGVGHLVEAGAEAYPSATVTGYEINGEHLDVAGERLSKGSHTERIALHSADFFAADWGDILASAKGRLLVIGNPPWVTSAGVSAIGGANLPVKSNFQGMTGIAARTGKANFDISEWMLIHLLERLQARDAVLAVLCKVSTASRVLCHAWRSGWNVNQASLYMIDAAVHFDAAVEACFLVATLGQPRATRAAVFDSLACDTPARLMGLVGKDIVNDLECYEQWSHLEGKCRYTWRSGLKHDCASVMELRIAGDGLVSNRLGETAAMDCEILFPLLKSTHLARGRLEPELHVLVTQSRSGEDTSRIGERSPLAWQYLTRHREHFAARKSSIYVSQPPFAIFGIGPYAFLPWRVAVSGLHWPPVFQIIGPVNGKPVMFDDTCYYLGFDTEDEARWTAEVLNSEPCQAFFHAISSKTSKRPVTAEMLHRLSISAAAAEAGICDPWEIENGEVQRQLALFSEVAV